jgi:hypothetical protein
LQNVIPVTGNENVERRLLQFAGVVANMWLAVRASTSMAAKSRAATREAGVIQDPPSPATFGNAR